MGWLGRLFGGASREEEAPGDGGGRRWVVLDVETSGLDHSSDTLLAIGAVAVHGTHVRVSDSFELVVRPQRASERENILVHGIGRDEQLSGMAPEEACASFLDYVGTAPLVAFHAPFDRGFLARAMKTYVGLPFDNPWVDVAELAPALHPDLKGRALDDWLQNFDITVDQRHHAASDAFATALLFVKLLAKVPPEERRPRQLARIGAQSRWIQR